jgi:hypothetical protein
VDLLIDLWTQGRLEERPQNDPEAEQASQEVEASFHQAVTTFVSENTNPVLLEDEIRHTGVYEGALNVEFGEFARLYDYMVNLAKRFKHPFKLVLITLEKNAGENTLPVNLENAMFFMDRAIRISIRDVDIVTQYNRYQFLVILLGTDNAGVKKAMDRIFKSYFRMNGSNAYSPFYMILEPENADQSVLQG